MESKLKITQTKSAAGEWKIHRATVRSLGLRRLRHSVIKEDTPAIRGMIKKISHLIKVETV
jgi:large subunit ribosomal protein L30